MTTVVQKVISGGQTGVDRAALDVAIELKIAHGGWCPKGRKAADGVLDSRYQLVEAESCGYRQRTKNNVRDSDGTLIIYMGQLEGGSLLTLQFAKRMNRPMFSLDVNNFSDAASFREWVNHHKIQTLNVAGPSESRTPEIYKISRLILIQLLRTQC